MSTHKTVEGAAAVPVGVSGLGLLVARRRRGRVIAAVARACHRYLSWYGNVNYDLHTNGELFVLERLGAFAPQVLFDVGANIGEWSISAASACPSAAIHAFEIAQPTFDTLVKNTRDLPAIHCTAAGLSDEEGFVRIRYYADLPALTTTAHYPHDLPFTECEAPVMTGDRYARQHGISHVDLLKIDAEGMEQQVLNGFGAMLGQGAIDLVQFEYGRVNVLNHFLLRDFYAFFRCRGYMVGKVFPSYVEFRDYDLADEDFAGPNYLACREERIDYLQAFGKR